MPFSLSIDQKQALDSVLTWFKEKKQPYLTFGGYAGTGKTTLLGLFRKYLYQHNPNLRVAFCAYTGKASQVLLNTLRGQHALAKSDTVSTLHRLLYVPLSDSDKAVQWIKRRELEVDLIVIDEASMVTSNIWSDVLSYGIPILAVGDHGQLPPIDASLALMKQPMVVLEHIHRQALESPIIQVSQLARQEGHIPVGSYGQGVRKYDAQDSSIGEVTQSLLEQWNMETLFLVGNNWSRQRLNRQIRHLRGYEEESPQSGDRVICLKNNWQAGIYNGLMGVVDSMKRAYSESGSLDAYRVDIHLDDGRQYSGSISPHPFEIEKKDALTEKNSGVDLKDQFDYGYALTVHKAQGSQAPKVVVWEERNKHMSDDDWRRWLYTAVTRAEKELILIGL